MTNYRKKYIDIYRNRPTDASQPSKQGMIKNYAQPFYPLLEKALRRQSRWPRTPVLCLKDKVVLDIGCGDGRFCYDSVKKFGAKKAYGLDIASVALGITNNYNNEKTQFIDSDASNIPLPDNSVDIITSFQVMEHFPQAKMDEIFHEFYRVTRQGWIFAISHQNNKKIHACNKGFSWWREKILGYTHDYFLYYPTSDDYKWGFGGNIGLSRWVCELHKDL